MLLGSEKNVCERQRGFISHVVIYLCRNAASQRGRVSTLSILYICFIFKGVLNHFVYVCSLLPCVRSLENPEYIPVEIC